MTIYKPYTYLIGWSKENKWYYGVRYSKKSNIEELWVKYFTSSKYVKEFRKLHGEPDIIKIRKIFNDSDNARLWESKVLKRMNVINDDKWLNKTDNISISTEAAGSSYNKKWINKGTEEIYTEKEKIDEYINKGWNLGRSEEHKKKSNHLKQYSGSHNIPHTNEVKNKISESKKGKHFYTNGEIFGLFEVGNQPKDWIPGKSDSFKRTMKKSLLGHKHSKEAKNKMRIAALKRKGV